MAEPNTVIITTSGRGSRMGALTEHTNKSLLPVAGKAIISHILDSYPSETKFIVCVGYKGDLVRQYLAAAHPELNITFVHEDAPTSLGRTLLEARKILGDDRPFIFHAGDTLVPIEFPSYNGGNDVYISEVARPEYRTVTVDHMSTSPLVINEKNHKGSYSGVYIGLIAVQETTKFWKLLSEMQERPELSDAHAVQQMINTGSKFSVVRAYWLDTGTPEALELANHLLSDGQNHVLSKSDQITYFVNGKVIKFFADPVIVYDRRIRANTLHKVVPKCIQYGDNFYTYTYTPGELARDVLQAKDLAPFLDWCKGELWTEAFNISSFQDLCYKFYYEKTVSRIKLFAKRHNFTPAMLQLCLTQLSLLPKEFWTDGIPTEHMHGDLHFSNIVLNETKGFTLIDWRENFAGSVAAGDVYYDLAKLLHGMIVSHDLVDDMTYGKHMRHQRHVECEREFEIWCGENGYDWQRVRSLCGLVFINIAPLHHDGYDRFLWDLGWSMLSEIYE